MDELCFIAEGLKHWGGPAQPEPEFAALVDFDGLDEPHAAGVFAALVFHTAL
jgi:hypothetical protein